MDPIIRLDSVEQTRAWRIGLLCACAALLAALVIVQQHGRSLHELTFDRPTPQQQAREQAYDPGVAALTVESKIFVMVASTGALTDTDLDEWLEELEPLAITRAERLRFAIVLADIGRGDDALARLDALREESAPGGGIQFDAEWLAALYRKGASALPEGVPESLATRHGWFGRLALAHGAPSHDPSRRLLMTRLWRIDRFQQMVGLGFLLAILLGVGSLALIIVHLRRAGFDWHGVFAAGATQTYDHLTGRMIGPVAGGDAAMLEMVAVFLLGLLLAVGAPIFAYAGGAEGATVTLVATELLMWTLLGVIAWPLLRGVDWRRLAEDVGLTRGAGIGREALFGTLGYMASLPLLMGASLLGAMIEGVLGPGEESSGASGCPLMEQPMAHSWAAVLLSAAGAVIWAPILEEAIFRGALFRFLRARMGAMLTILITASAFAIAHPYNPLGLMGVMVGGIVFGLLREWRGSLVAPMVAHALHNAVVVGPTIVYLRLLEM
jgi:membrane protease YdiL (CAAX protease family)